MERAPPPGNQWEHYGRSRQMWQYDISPSHRSVSSGDDDDDICVMIKCVCVCVCVCVCLSRKMNTFSNCIKKRFDMCSKMFHNLFACMWRKMINFSRRSVGVVHHRDIIHHQDLVVHFLVVVHHNDVIHHQDVIHFLVVVQHNDHHEDLVEMRRNTFGLVITLPCSSPWSLQPWVFNHGMVELLHFFGLHELSVMYQTLIGP